MFGVIIIVWHYGSTPYDLNLNYFLPIVSSIFLAGQILEWKYHISYPFSEVQESYDTKKYLMYFFIFVVVLGALITFFCFTFDDYDFPKMFLAFLVILTLSLLTLFFATIYNKLSGYCSKCKDKLKCKNKRENEQNEDTQDTTKGPIAKYFGCCLRRTNNKTRIETTERIVSNEDDEKRVDGATSKSFRCCWKTKHDEARKENEEVIEIGEDKEERSTVAGAESFRCCWKTKNNISRKAQRNANEKIENKEEIVPLQEIV